MQLFNIQINHTTCTYTTMRYLSTKSILDINSSLLIEWHTKTITCKKPRKNGFISNPLVNNFSLHITDDQITSLENCFFNGTSTMTVNNI